MKQDDLREFSRVGFSTRAEVDVNGQTVRGEIRDISMNGAWMHASHGVEPGAPCETRIFLGDGEPITICAEGIVTRCDASGFAIHFTALRLESFSHLRNLVLLNSPEPEQAESEMDAHIGIAPANRARPA